MHDQRLAEGAGFAHEHAAALAQRTIDGFDDAGAAAAFGTAPVLPTRQHPHVALPQVCEIPAARTPPVPRQLRPQAPGRGRAAVAQHPGHDAPAVALHRQPEPNLALFAAHERPHLIQFQHRPALALPLFRP